MSNDEGILNELRCLTGNRESWKSKIGDVAAILGENHSVEVVAKALWLLGEMGLKYPEEVEPHIEDIAAYLDDDNPKLRERSVNAMGRIGRADKDLAIPYMNNLMQMKDDESGNVRHAFVWACENIASNAPELLEEFLDEKPSITPDEIFYITKVVIAARDSADSGKTIEIGA